MITIEDLKNYFFVVSQDPKNNGVIIAVQIEYNNVEKGKDSYIKIFPPDRNFNYDQAKAITMAEFLEKLNEANG